MKARKVLVPLDDSLISVQTVKRLIALKENITLPLTLLHILDLSTISYRGFAESTFSEIEERARKGAQKFIDAQKDLFTAAGIEAVTLLKEGHARETICELADSGEYDLLVIGKHVESQLRNLLFDQVANHVIHQVKCPVMIV